MKVIYVISILIIYLEMLYKAIILKSGNILLRLDGSKFWNINRIQYDDNLLSVDNPSAHYGMTYNPAGSKFFIGSGHKESGEGEVVKSLIIKVDNKKIDISRQISGKKITVEKISQIKELLVKYSFVLEENILLSLNKI